MQILFDKITSEIKPEYETCDVKFSIEFSFTSDDPEELTKYVNSKLEQVRTNIVAWKFEDKKVSVGVGHFYTTFEFGESDYPYWWVE